MMGQPPPIHLWELYVLLVSLEPKGGGIRGEEAAGSRRGPGEARDELRLTYPTICPFSARDEEDFCGFAVDRDGATDDAGPRTVFFAH